LQEVETLSESHVDLHFREGEGEAVRFIATIIDYAIARRASDIHLLPKREGTYLRLRQAQQILSHPEPICALPLHSRLVNRIKALAKLDLSNHRIPQDGAFTVPLPKEERHIRVSTLPTIHGEKLVLRILGMTQLEKLEDLGYTERCKHSLQTLLDQEAGVILVTGPTGSGKTTTLYALLHELTRKGRSILTIEDPVEIFLPTVSQTSVSEKHGLTYSVALRAALRQDPDVIMLGEVRDKESARLLLQGALTGHLMLSTVHSRNSLEAIMRLQSLETDMGSIVQALSAVLNQRLLPKLCQACRVFDLASSTQDIEVMQPVGCSKCDYSGYDGTILLEEMFVLTPRWKALLQEAKNELFFLSSRYFQEVEAEVLSTLRELLKSGVISWEVYKRFERRSPFDQNDDIVRS
jgi:type II secretory ATPase GspE/PulE/Tfp pilus assembly ATPase PilB-like protein